MSAVEGSANMAFRVFNHSVELDRVALLLRRGLLLQGRSVLAAFV